MRFQQSAHFTSQVIVTLSQKNYVLDLAAKFNLPRELKPKIPIIRADYYKLLESSKDDPILDNVPFKELSLTVFLQCLA